MRRAAIIGLVGAVVLLVAGGSDAGTRVTTYWGIGVAAPLPANAATGAVQDAQVDDVSCPFGFPGNCSAVGSYVDRAGNARGMLLTKTAGTWAPAVEARGSYLRYRQPFLVAKVSCASPGNCAAIGGALIFTETNGLWSPGVRPTLPPNAAKKPYAGLYAISCSSAGNCSAVGGYTDTAGNIEAFVVTEESGVSATGVEVQLPADAAAANQDVLVGSLSCPSDGSCTAVGEYVDKSRHEKALLLDETASTWGAAVAAQLPANAVATKEYGLGFFFGTVSCGSAGNCSAVGTYCAVIQCGETANGPGGSKGEEAFHLDETAGAWASGVEVVLPPNAATRNPVSYFHAISCTPPANCSAVGDYTGRSSAERVFMLTKTGTSWSWGVQAVLPPNAAAEQGNLNMNSISCPSDGLCAATGVYDVHRIGNVQPLLLSEWTNGAWLQGQGVALPADGVGRYRYASLTVSCSSVWNCTAVGSYQTAGGAGDTTAPYQGLLVDGPTANALVNVSDLEGLTMAAAKRAILSRAGAVGAITYVKSRRARGRVVSQSPKAGEAVAPGTTVDLAVSKGPKAR